jgi:hypothetical protein
MGPVFLLGAGFTRAVVGHRAPLTHELMAKLDISKFPEIREEYERAFPDIEQFISILDLKVLHFRQINNLISYRLNNIREDIVRQILNQVDMGSLHLENLESYPILKCFLEKVPRNSCILTLNYDCVLDQGLYYTGRWSPFGGYCYTTFPHTENENDSKDRILLLKLHGSCNFRDSGEGQEYFKIEITNSIFPSIHATINSDPSDKPHILVMSYIKQFHNGIMSLWREAISFLREAEKLIIVGCSLREEDTFLRFALYHFGMKKNTQRFFIEIVDKGDDNCEKIKEKVMKLVAYPDRQEVNLFHEGLENYLNNT